MRSVLHPGPVAASRIDVAPCAGEPIAVTLDAGISLEDAVAKATANYDSAWLEIENAPVTQLDYVIPALAPDDTHVAWYSDIHSFGGSGRAERVLLTSSRHH